MSQDTNASRREFLKNGTAALAGTAMVSNLTSLSSPVHAAGNDELKIGLVGCGGRGTGAAREALRADPQTRLVAVADAFQDRADRSLASLKEIEEISARIDVDSDHVFIGLDGYRHVIESCDVVLLCTPPGFRAVHLAAAVSAGKHIFVEKPMATDSPGVRSVIESVKIAKQKDLALLAGYCWRYDDAKRALFEKILDGAIGDIRAVYGTYLTSPVKPMPPASTRPTEFTDLQWMVRNWYNFTWLSGDGVVEQACHTADWIAWAFGDTPPLSCTAVGGRQIPAEGGDIFDHVEINYVWDNGARGFLAQRQIPRCYNQNSLYVLGTQGNANLTRGSRISDLNDEPVWRYEGPRSNMYQNEHNKFFASIRSGNHINNGDRMVTSTLMGIMGRTAGYTGEQVTWDMAMNSQETLVPTIHDGWNSPVEFRDVPRPGL